MAAPDAIKPTAATETADIDVEKGRKTSQHSVRTSTSSDTQTSRGDLWLQVTDVDFQGKNPTIQACVSTGDEDVEQILSSLPELAEHTARIYDYAVFFSDSEHWESLSKSLEPYASSDDALRGSCGEFGSLPYGFDDIRWQWSDFRTDHKLYSSILIRSRSTDRWEQYLHPKIDPHQGNLILAGRDDSYYRLSTCLKCCAIGKDKLIGQLEFIPIVSCLRSSHDLTHCPSTVVHRYLAFDPDRIVSRPGQPRLADILCDPHSITALSDGSRVLFTKLAVLDLLKFYIHDLRTRSRSPFAMDDSMWSVTENYTSKIQYAASLVESAESLKDVIDHVVGGLASDSKDESADELATELEGRRVDSLASGSKDKGVDKLSAELEVLLSDLQFVCTRLKKHSVANLSRHQRNWEIYRDTLNVHESEGVKRLTLLAAAFLPLSLSSSILAMNTRFVDLQLLLYDFVGVFVLVGSIAILFYLVIGTAIKIARWSDANLLIEARSKYELRGAKLFTYSTLIIPWAAATAAFTVGMVQNVVLGLKILGYSFAGIAAIGLLWYPVAYSIAFISGFMPSFVQGFRAEKAAIRERRAAAGRT